MLINFPTLLIALLAESFTLFVTIGLLTCRCTSNRKGMRWLTTALGVLSLSFLLGSLHNMLPHPISGGLANIGLSTSIGLLSYALRGFCNQDKLVPTYVQWAPPLTTAALFLITGEHFGTFINLLYCVLIAQELQVVFCLCRIRTTLCGGRNMLNAGLILNLVSLVALRFTIGHGPEGMALQSLLFLSCFPTLMLIVLGYILMDKDSEEELLRHLAMKDNLTQCWNRNYLEPAATQEMQRMLRHGTPVALVILDIDLFKNINDHFGHTIGDQMLKGFAETACSCIRKTDSIIRWGGEEFVLLLPSADLNAAAGLAERIRGEFSTRIFPGGAHATVSAGYAAFQTTDSWQDWFTRADEALYRAKSHGRNRVEPSFSEKAGPTGKSRNSGRLLNTA